MENKRVLNPGCFFCQKPFNNESVNVFNFSPLFHYLKIKLKLDQKSVFLCSQCNKMACQLCEQINKLEVTQMKINYSLEQLISKLCTKSDSDSGALLNLVKVKCIFQLRTVKYPQVKLKRLPKVQIVVPVFEPAVMSHSPSSTSPLSPEPEESIVKREVDDDDPNDHSLESKHTDKKYQPPSKHPKNCRFCAQTLRNSEFRYYHEVEKHPDKLLLEAKFDNTTDSQFLQICKDVMARYTVTQSTNKKELISSYGCLYCQNVYKKMKSLKHHTTKHHLPSLIEKVKQLQKIVSKSKNFNHDKNGLQCQYCDCVFINQADLQNHKITSCNPLNGSAIESHINSIDYTEEGPVMSSISSSLSPASAEPEVTSIKMEFDDDHQPTAIWKSKPKSTKKLKPSDNPKACRFCSKVLNNFRVCEYHEVVLHPDKLLMEGKLDNKSDSQFFEICQDVLTRYKVPTSQISTNTSNRYACLYCQNSYNHIKCLKRHTIQCHRPNTIEKVRKMQKIQLNYNKLACRYCSNVFTNGIDLKNHKITECEILGELVVLKCDLVDKPIYPQFKLDVTSLLPGQKIPCQFCPKTFQSVSMLRIHSNVQHYLQYLNQAKLENVSDEQFEICCQDTFEGYYSRQTGNSRRECVYCKKSFPFFRSYKSHLIDKHIDILYNKLKEQQNNPPKIIKCGKDESCDKIGKRVCQYCGKWVPRQRLRSHLKYHCKEKTDKLFFKECKCHKRFYSMEDLNSHLCSGSRTKRQYVKRVQCDKCGTQINADSLRQHQLKFCGKPKKRTRVYEKRKRFVSQNLTDVVANMNAQICPLLKNMERTSGSSKSEIVTELI